MLCRTGMFPTRPDTAAIEFQSEQDRSARRVVRLARWGVPIEMRVVHDADSRSQGQDIVSCRIHRVRGFACLAKNVELHCHVSPFPSVNMCFRRRSLQDVVPGNVGSQAQFRKRGGKLLGYGGPCDAQRPGHIRL